MKLRIAQFDPRPTLQAFLESVDSKYISILDALFSPLAKAWNDLEASM